ncbi:MAG: hypothetical protein KAQ84_00950 [Thermoplasmatales archaeon]|nr:hypothetical protein [Thermoplasmatales archaeon]MCK5261390.1 hypothetical protein [Thermoplasmatales archaeon]
MENVKKRPTGVTILAILQIIFAIILLIGALGMFLVAALTGIEEVKDAIGEEVPGWVVDNAAVFFGAMGAVFLILAIVGFGLGYGYLKGIGLAWTLGIIFAVLSIIGEIINPIIDRSLDTLVGSIIGIIIPLIIIYYLTRPHVKTFFGKA